MKTIYLFEPAMCCPTGMCGPSIDPELMRISTVSKNLERQGIRVERFNLKNNPNEFVKNSIINQLITQQGVNALPATLIDGKIVKTEKYPTNEEIARLLNIPESYLGGNTKVNNKPDNSGDCGCEGGCC
jgi:hypothetical protein